YDSVPEAEEKETQIKARALLETLEEAIRPAQGGPDPDDPAAITAADGTVLAAGTILAGVGAAGTDGEPVPKVLLVDHQDSFVHTLADYFRQHGADVTTLRFGFPPVLLDSYTPALVLLSPR